jgi:hypothetical protein
MVHTHTTPTRYTTPTTCIDKMIVESLPFAATATYWRHGASGRASPRRWQHWAGPIRRAGRVKPLLKGARLYKLGQKLGPSLPSGIDQVALPSLHRRSR